MASTSPTPNTDRVAFRRFSDHSTAELAANGLHVRQVSDIDTGKAVLIERMFFCGGNIIFCTTGSFRFSFGDGAELTLSTGEALVLYPGTIVTIAALAAHNHLRYIIIDEGMPASEFLNSFAFYDRLVFRADLQHGNFSTLQALAAAGAQPSDGHAAAIALLSDTLRTIQHTLRQENRALFFDAVSLIHSNLSRGIVRTEPLCEELRTSRTRLHQEFVRNCGCGPGEFIRREQLRIALWHLTNTRRSIKEIAAATGIPSNAYFTIFIRRMTGQSPSDIRRKGLRQPASDVQRGLGPVLLAGEK